MVCPLTVNQTRPELIFSETMVVSMLGLPLLVAHLLIPCASGFSAASPSIQVFDNVLDTTTAAKLHESAKVVGLGHRVFARPLKPGGVYNPIERALDSILLEMNGGDNEGDTTYVEYWARQEWRSIEAHADVDEFRAKEEDASSEAPDFAALGPDGYRYPTFGHVLYLQVGSEVRGPTCVWPGRRSAGELLKKVGDNDEGDQTCESSQDADQIELLIVPAQGGRLLRFPGSALHAVPRPHNLWFLPFVMGSAVHEPVEEYGRSVILFNVWEDEAPKGVSLNSGDGHSGDDPTKGSDDKVQCIAKSDWITNEIQDTGKENDETKAAKIWLLGGNERRRDHPMRTIKMSAPAATQDALAEQSIVSRVWISQ